MAAGLQEFDPGIDYASDVFAGPRKEGYERNIAIGYVRHAVELSTSSESEFLRRFNTELSRAVRKFESPRTAAGEFIKLHQRHGGTVFQVVTDQLKRHAEQFVLGQLEPTSMLALVAGQKHQILSWRRFAEEITHVLQEALPMACHSHKPENETHLQEICDGILRGHDLKLRREYPFMVWSSALTKPDWSIDKLNLVVEAKYIRTASDIRKATEELAADVTKYSDNDRYALYLVYDHAHLIQDDGAFVAPLTKHDTMVMRFVR
jgi:hypothetical protein